jgi:UDP-N-acetylglucosamine 2-epimerase (non-hydrolysing)
LLTLLAYQFIAHIRAKSYFILIDLGGIKEESPSLGKPFLILCNKTERPEEVEATKEN